MQDGWDWTLTMRQGKEEAGPEWEEPQRFAACSLEVSHGLTPTLCQSRRAARQSHWEHCHGKEPWGNALCCAPSLSVAGRYLSPRGRWCSWDSRGQCAASLLCHKKEEREKICLRAWMQERCSPAQSTIFRGKQINVFWGFLPPLTRKKYTQILCARENQVFFSPLSGNNVCLYKGLIQRPKLTSRDFESGARMA